MADHPGRHLAFPGGKVLPHGRLVPGGWGQHQGIPSKFVPINHAGSSKNVLVTMNKRLLSHKDMQKIDNFQNKNDQKITITRKIKSEKS